MKKLKKIIYLLILLSFTLVASYAYSQNISGNWYGIGLVKDPNYSKIAGGYLSELIIEQKKGGAINGQFNYYFRDGLFSHKILGTFDKEAKRLRLAQIDVVFFQTIDTKNAVECPMFGKFKLMVNSSGDSTLEGELYSDEDHKYVAAPIYFSFQKKRDSVAVPIENLISSKKVLIDSPLTTPKARPVVQPATDTLLAIRAKIPVDILDVTDSVVHVQLFDNGDIDYDSVTIYYNGQLIQSQKMLSHDPISLTLPINTAQPYNELSMLANNTGLIPPNTAALIVYDGDKKYEYIMASDFNKTATLRLRRKLLSKK